MTFDLSLSNLERIEQIAARVEPPFGPAEKAVLFIIEFADKAMPDPEAEPSLGWPLGANLNIFWPIEQGPDPISENRTDRAEYQNIHCCDLEGEHDGLEPVEHHNYQPPYSDDPDVPQYIDFPGSEVSK